LAALDSVPVLVASSFAMAAESDIPKTADTTAKTIMGLIILITSVSPFSNVQLGVKPAVVTSKSELIKAH
jgi:hypothetical protein